MYCYTISSFYSLLPASYICRSTLQPVSLSQSSKRITAATFRECFTVNRIVFYVVRENHVVNFGAYHKIYKIFTLKILNIHPIWGSNPGPLDQKSNALSSALMGLIQCNIIEVVIGSLMAHQLSQITENTANNQWLLSSVGQSVVLITRRSWVRSPQEP